MTLSDAPLQSELMKAVEYQMERYPILENHFFTSLRSDAMSREVFERSQRQFFFAVRYFSRPMAALLARMPDSTSRQGLIHNLAEEHGFEVDEPGASSFDPSVAHDLTFLTFLQSLGISRNAMSREREGPAVKAFNTALMGCCLMEPVETAFATLGAIEYAFADISELIGRKVVERGWVAQENLVHYKLHAQIDKRHAADFFKVVEHSWDGDGRSRVEDGILLGLHLFNRLYEDLASLSDHGN